MFQFIHTADIHLDSPLRGLERYDGAPADAIRAASRRALENLVELAIDERVAFVLVAGDLYDGDWKDYNTGLFLVGQMAKLKEAEIAVLIISGNHDAASQITRHLHLPENVTLLSSRRPQTVLLPEVDVAVHGQGYATRAVTEDLSKSYPTAETGLFNIGLLHTSLTGREGHASYAPCTVEGLGAKGYDYWALGHVHQLEVVCKDPWIVFPGNIQGRHARETGAKGCTLVTVEDGAVCEVDHRDLDVLRWVLCEVDANGASSTDEITERVREALGAELERVGEQTLAVRVHIYGATEAHGDLAANPEHWRNEIRATALDLGAERIWIEKLRLRTQSVADLDAILARDDALGSLLAAIRELRSNDDQLGELTRLFDDLRPKLPGDLTSGEDGLDLQHPETMRQAIDDARELLLAGLLSEGDAR